MTMNMVWVVLYSILSIVSTAWSVRLAEAADVQAIVDVVLAAMPGDPSWGYRYPNRTLYYRDHRKFHTRLFEYLIAPKHDDWLVVVAEEANDDNPAETVIASIAVWNVSYVNQRKYGASYSPQDRKSQF
jgi:hypothetical protein